MTRIVPVVDLFAGPGGLAEGFSAYRQPDGSRKYRIALSVEKDHVAHRTLRLRAFLRKFPKGFPQKYYDFLNGELQEEPDWATLYPVRWAAACDETRCLELGTSEASAFLRGWITKTREKHGGRTVLLGGPPCQAYSVIGRSRNAGNADYKADEDDRQSLYEQYVDVLSWLRPAMAVMENVRGILSARLNGELVFPKLMRRLQHAGDSGYRLFALSPRSVGRSWQDGLKAEDLLVHAEEHGVPQARHRVFVVCVRSDVAAALDEEHLPRLEPQDDAVPLADIISEMPRLRSRLSRDDDPDSWQAALRASHDLIAANQPEMSSAEEEALFRGALAYALAAANEPAPPSRDACGQTDLPADCPRELRDWIFDEHLRMLPNNETRAHMAGDLTRYLFAAAFGCAFGRSPKTFDFPEALMPNHANWRTGHFDDRYRVQLPDGPCTTVTSHLSKDGHSFIHPDPGQCRSLTVREVARLQTFPDNYFFQGTRTQQYVQVGNAVPPFLARQIALTLSSVLDRHDRAGTRSNSVAVPSRGQAETTERRFPLVAMERS